MPYDYDKMEKDDFLSGLNSRKASLTGNKKNLLQPKNRSFHSDPLSLFPIVTKLLKCPMCKETLSDPRTLACLHSFCLGCLESQKARAPQSSRSSMEARDPQLSRSSTEARAPQSSRSSIGARAPQSSQLSCHQCGAPFTLTSVIGVSSLECNAFIKSLAKTAKANKGDVNRVIKCDGCREENANVHCVDCQENFGPSCLIPHKNMKISAAHKQISLTEAMSGDMAIKRLPRCQKHAGLEIDSYCRSCNQAICARCGIENHSGHTFCPLSQVTGPLQDEIVGFAVTIGKKEQQAREAIVVMDNSIKQIEDRGTAAKKEMASFFTSLHAELDARQAKLTAEIKKVREASISQKRDVETATVQFREFLNFTDGLLVHGTPLEIADTHKMVRNCASPQGNPAFQPIFECLCDVIGPSKNHDSAATRVSDTGRPLHFIFP